MQWRYLCSKTSFSGSAVLFLLSATYSDVVGWGKRKEEGWSPNKQLLQLQRGKRRKLRSSSSNPTPATGNTWVQVTQTAQMQKGKGKKEWVGCACGRKVQQLYSGVLFFLKYRACSLSQVGRGRHRSSDQHDLMWLRRKPCQKTEFSSRSWLLREKKKKKKRNIALWFQHEGWFLMCGQPAWAHGKAASTGVLWGREGLGGTLHVGQPWEQPECGLLPGTLQGIHKWGKG